MFFLMVFMFELSSQTPKPQTPFMGWASWNNYRVNISKKIINAQTDAMVLSGLRDVGYNYINIDDGFFNGRNTVGSLKINFV